MSSKQDVVVAVSSEENYFEGEAEQIAGFKKGKVFEIQLEKQKVKAKVIDIFDSISGYEDGGMVHLTLVDQSIPIEVGSTGTIETIVDQKKQVLYVPRRAVINAHGKTCVYVVGEKNTRRMQEVELGISDESNIEVKSGVKENEKIILK